jgi:hypothetical protein
VYLGGDSATPQHPSEQTKKGDVLQEMRKGQIEMDGAAKHFEDKEWWDYSGLSSSAGFSSIS